MEKRYLFIAALLLTAFSGLRAEEWLNLEDFTIQLEETKTVEVLLENPDAEYRDIQFDLYLPKGVSVATDSEGEYLYELGSRCTANHALMLAEVDGHYVGMLYSSGSAPLTGNSGAIISLTLKADKNTKAGKTKGYFRNVSLSKKNATGPTYKEFSFNITVKGKPLAWQLKEGWNWVSHNLTSNLNPTELFGENMAEVKSQTKGIIRDEKYGIVGNLTELNAVEAYKVKTTKADTEPYQLTGDLFDAEANAITLKEGWNWIGYPMANEATVGDALKGFAPKENDMIVDQEDFTSYSAGSWIGTLTKLVPGRGYMYKSGETKSVHFTSKAEAKMRVEAKARTESSHWTCNIYKYPNRMPAIVSLYMNNVLADVINYDIAAFCGDECRGVGKVVEDVVMMNVCGEGNETITFKALDRQTGIMMDIEESVPFTGDVLGAYTEPFKLNLGEESATRIEIVDSSPLTVDDKAIYNVAGQRIGTLQKGVNIIRMKDGTVKKIYVK